jgi:hypothetical protein
MPFMNWLFGYHGYGKEKMRRNSDGNRNESTYRKVFIKDLDTKSNMNLDSFNIFIEKGYKYGYFSANETNFLTEETKYPYQISHTDRTHNNEIVYFFIEQREIDSIGYHLDTYLTESILKDTLEMQINKFRMTKENGINKAVWDSIGFIKVYEKQKTTANTVYNLLLASCLLTKVLADFLGR